MDEKLKMFFSTVLGGYLFSLGFYFIWCFYFFYEKLHRGEYFLVIAAAVFAITAVYFFSLLLISYVRSFQKVWTSFSLVSVITLLIFFLIPSTNSEIYYKFHDYKLNLKQDKTIKTIDKNELERKFMAVNKKEIQNHLEDAKEVNRKKEIDAKFNHSIKIIDFANKSISDTKNQEIIFKIQIIASSTRLATNSPQLKGLKNVWEYKDSGLYKYTVGNQKDLKSASALQSKFRRKGFVGAFVVAFRNGKRIPMKKAIDIYKMHV